MNIRNVDDCEFSPKHGEYGGASGLKDGLIIDGENWLVKYPKNAKYLTHHEEMEYTNDPVSEYIGSHIYKLLGYPVHETMLVERNNKICVACKDFLENDGRLVEFRTIKNSANSKLSELLDENISSTGSEHCVEFNEMLLHLQYNDILINIDGIEDRFYNQIVVDAFINNSDRNNGNWGIIRTPNKNDVLAPIYDNGGAMNGKTPDSRLLKMLETDKGVENNVLNGICAYGQDGKNFLTRNLLNMDIEPLKDAIVRNVPLISDKMDDIKQMIESVSDIACSGVRKRFYIETLDKRMELLLLPIYEKLNDMQHENNDIDMEY